MDVRRPQPTPDRFIGLFMQEQRRLLAYTTMLVGNVTDAEEVLAEATAVMWEKFDAFELGSDFRGWASQIVRYKVMEYRRSRGRRALLLSDSALEAVASEHAGMGGHLDAEFQALSACLSRLPEADRRLLMQRYDGSTRVADLAESIGRSTVTLRKILARLHRRLLDCISRRLAEEVRP